MKGSRDREASVRLGAGGHGHLDVSHSQQTVNNPEVHQRTRAGTESGVDRHCVFLTYFLIKQGFWTKVIEMDKKHLQYDGTRLW